MARDPQDARAGRAARRRAGFALVAMASATLHAGGDRVDARDVAPFTVTVGRYRLQSNPWVNLHQRLLHESRLGSAAPDALAGGERARWRAAVEGYRTFVGRRHPIFDADLIAVNDALAATSGEGSPESIPRAVSSILESAMPLYRQAQWEADDRANRFWIAVATPMLASAGEELAEAHGRAYGRPFPTRILVDVSPRAWEFRAYTVGEGESAHVVITSTEPGYQGFAALEMLFHEPRTRSSAPTARTRSGASWPAPRRSSACAPWRTSGTRSSSIRRASSPAAPSHGVA